MKSRKNSALLNGRFRLGRALGRGGEASAWVAHDEVRGVDVALKRLERADADAEARMQREFRVLAALTHPHLPRVFDLAISQGCEEVPAGAMFFTSELMSREARTEDYVSLERGLRAEQLLRLVAEVAGALAALHALGILHRDVKPSNIWIAQDGSARLGDLGLALERGAARGARGTLAYLAPEALVGQASERSDLYALGLCARALWGEAIERAPDGLRELVERLSARDEAQRPSSAEAVRTEAARLSGRGGRGGAHARIARDGLEALAAARIAARVLGAEGPRVLLLCGAPGAGRSSVLARALATVELEAIEAGHEGVRVVSQHAPWSDPDSAARVVWLAEARSPRAREWIARARLEQLGDTTIVVAESRQADEERLGAGVERIEVGAVDEGDATAWVKSILPSANSKVTATVVQRARGNIGRLVALARAVWVQADGSPIAMHHVVAADVRSAPIPALDASTRAEVIARYADEIDTLVARGDLEEAETPSVDLMALDAASARARLCRARVLVASARYREAADLLSSAASDEARILRARALLRGGGEDDVEASLVGVGGVEAAILRARWMLNTQRVAEAARVLALIPPLEGKLAIERNELDVLVALYSGDAARARRLLEDGAALAGDRMTLSERARRFALDGMVATFEGDPSHAAEVFAEARRIADAVGDDHGAAVYASNLGAALRELGRYAEALAPLTEAARWIAQAGKPNERWAAWYAEGALLVVLGAEAEADARAEVIDASGGAGYAALVRGELALRREDVAAVAREFSSARAWFSAHEAIGTRQALYATLTLAALAAESGDVTRASEWVADVEAESLAGDLALTASSVKIAVARARGVSTTALRRPLQEALDETARKSRHPEALRTALVLARGAIDDGDGLEALEYLLKAKVSWEAMMSKTPELRRDGARKDPDAKRLRELLSALGGGDEAAHPTPRADSDDASAYRRLLEINKQLNSELRLPRLLERILDTTIELTQAERGILLLASDDGAELTVRHARNFDKKSLDEGGAVISRSIAARACREGKTIVTLDAAGDDRFEEALSVVDLKLRSVLAAPLAIKGKIVGCVYVDHRLRPGAFDEDHVRWVSALAEQAAIAIENARLVADNTRKRREVADLARELERKVESQTVEIGELRKQVAEDREALAVRYNYDRIIGRTPRMLEMFRLLDRVTDTSLPVVIHGESGTGKELVARAIHHNGPRKDQSFVSESCAAIPESLLEAALFGHVRGAFTGAEGERRGLFEIAHGGTLFLDEVGEMSPGMQSKLLRVLQEGELRRVGGERTIKVDVRVIVASNRELQRLVEAGSFREDLFYRLSVVTVNLPPLRERPEDIPLLVEHFLAKATVAKGKPKRLSRAALSKLVAYRWPGNVRELENEIVRASALSGDLIGVDDLSPNLAAGADAGQIANPEDLDLKMRVEALERGLLREALGRTRGNQSQAAKLLGLSRFGLQKKMRRYGVG